MLLPSPIPALDKIIIFGGNSEMVHEIFCDIFRKNCLLRWLPKGRCGNLEKFKNNISKIFYWKLSSRDDESLPVLAPVIRAVNVSASGSRCSRILSMGRDELPRRANIIACYALPNLSSSPRWTDVCNDWRKVQAGRMMLPQGSKQSSNSYACRGCYLDLA